MLIAFTDGARESINQKGGGSGGGSSGRGNDKAVNDSSSTRPSTSSSSTVNIASSTPSRPAQSSQQESIQYNNGNDSNSNQNTNNNQNTNSNINNNSGGTTSFIGTTGTLADRKIPVSCPICMAVPNWVYNEGHRVDVGTGVWTCGYLQETMQDVNRNSQYETERNSCRQAQLKAEEGGCCESTMFADLPGEDIHDACDLCGGGLLPRSKADLLVDTHLLGKHTCASIDNIMKQRMLSTNMCDGVKGWIASTCCSVTATGRTALRGGIADDAVP